MYEVWRGVEPAIPPTLAAYQEDLQVLWSWDAIVQALGEIIQYLRT